LRIAHINPENIKEQFPLRIISPWVPSFLIVLFYKWLNCCPWIVHDRPWQHAYQQEVQPCIFSFKCDSKSS
jgi:hypothetical protein